MWLLHLTPMDSNKSEISFTSSNSHNNMVSIKIGSENKQAETEREENRCLTRPHTRHGGSLRARVPRGPPRVGVGQRHRVGRFTCGVCRGGQVCAPDECLAGWGRNSPIPPLSSIADRRVAASTLSPAFFLIFQVSSRFDLFSFDFFIFQFVIRFDKFSSQTL